MGKKLLIVEDHADIRSLLRMTLEDEGHELLECADAATGELLVRDWRPDLVLLDIMMPGAFDGLELCRRIKNEPSLSRTKVLLISARGHRNDLQIGRLNGADEYLIKPFSPHRLLEQVRLLLGGEQAESETVLDISL